MDLRFTVSLATIAAVALAQGCGSDEKAALDATDTNTADAAEVQDIALDYASDPGIGKPDQAGIELPTDPGYTDPGVTDQGKADDIAGDNGQEDAASQDTGPKPPECADPAPFDEDGPYGLTQYEKAADFTLPVLGGEWNFKDHWGCDSFIFVQYAKGYEYSEGLWTSNPKWLLDVSPKNVHYFFLSFESTAKSDVMAMRDSVEAALAKMSPEDAAHWKDHIHYVPVRAGDLEGWVGDVLRKQGMFAFSIDRFQRMRETGGLVNIAAINSSPQLYHLENEALQFNFEWDREQAMKAEDATVLTVFDKAATKGGDNKVDVEFPDAGTMAGFDSLDVDLFMDCKDYDTCPWDYIAALYLCDKDDPDKCGTEIARWITTYGRDGRWVTDISQVLAYLQDGGTRRLRFDSSSQGYTTTLKLRLVNRGKGMRPVAIQPLFSGNNAFNLDYNGKFQPFQFDSPEGVKKVEIFGWITGHGFGNDKANCAEFCNHTHHFKVNDGQEYVKEHPMAGTLNGCKDQVVDGVIPNQHGTWSLGRGGWCPGFDVKPFVADITQSLISGNPQTITYRALFQGKDYDPQPVSDPNGFGANIHLNTFLVFWE
ncbi:MAG: hypothetical protein GXP54_02210 [Deltaproteobacteria bacterium]|nr:hypothetical protein [Deltaproteobacteria bacterium]